jgi:hypothetical protein
VAARGAQPNPPRELQERTPHESGGRQLTPSERDGWISKLEVWSGKLAAYADSDSFEAALLALTEGWDDPELKRLL